MMVNAWQANSLRATIPVRLRLRCDLNLVCDYANFVTINLNLRAVGPGAIANFEAPGMPGAGDDAFVDFPRPQRSAHVRASIVDRKVLAARIEYRDQPLAHRDRNALSFWNRTYFGDRFEFRHYRATV